MYKDQFQEENRLLLFAKLNLQFANSGKLLSKTLNLLYITCLTLT